MKFHRHLVEAIVSGLIDIFSQGYHADKVIERNLKANRKWGARDRRFYAESTYEIVRWWRRLWYAVDQPPSADQTALWCVLGAWFAISGETLPPWPEWKSLPLSTIITRFREVTEPAIRESVPDWLFAMGEKGLGKKWPEILFALNEPAPVFLRVNTLKTNQLSLQQQLEKEGIPVEVVPETQALVLKERKNVFVTAAFREGLFEVQDLHSQQVAPFLQPQPGERIIDGCAGAGGKTLHLATLMRNKGRIIALDVSPHKLSELQKRARRAGISNVETRLIESGKTVKRLFESADRVLLDVPCTGLGVLRRNPDTKWKLNSEEIHRLNLLQAEILSHYATMTKPSGKLVYSTCSILPSENEMQIEEFINVQPVWKLEAQQSLLPEPRGGDGFFMARLTR